MLLQQVILSAVATQHSPQLATLQEQLTAQHAQEVAELKERHQLQLREIELEREQERMTLEKRIPREWVVGIDVRAQHSAGWGRPN